MAEYHISRKAIQDLDNIWNYTAQIWSEDQADRYIQNIYEAFVKISKSPCIIGRRLSIKGYYSATIKSHCIFYYIGADGKPYISRILHKMMDFANNLS